MNNQALGQMIKKIPIENYADPIDLEQNQEKGIGQSNTASSGPDNGAMKLIAKRFWKCKRHDTVTKSIDNALIPVLRSETDTEDENPENTSTGINICGHGSPGTMEAGNGQSLPYNKYKYYTPWNENIWGVDVDRLKNHPSPKMFLWGCHVGAEDDGADLLFQLAKRSAKVVRSGTAFLYVSSEKLWWGKGNKIQTATPTVRPVAIPQPDKTMIEGKIEFQKGDKVFTMLEIEKIDIYTSNVITSETSEKHFAGTEAQNFAQKVFISSALDMHDISALGFITAKFQITFKGDYKISFDIINDGLALDNETETGYYINSTYKTI